MKEQLSALIDGEFDTHNADHLLIVAKSNGELRRAWNEYHMIGDVMRGDAVLYRDVASRILDALDEEPTVIAPAMAKAQAGVKQPLFKKTAFWSVAASVTAVMFVGLMLLQQQKAEQTLVTPIEIAESLPNEYLAAHQTYAPNSASYYIQSASYTEQR